MQLITDEYRKLNNQLHDDNANYGVNGARHTMAVFQLCQRYKTTDVLDYGCGKAFLARNLPFIIQNYDPAIHKYNKEPKPADIVVCGDVLEHIEPECLENILNHLQSLTKKILVAVISLKPALKKLPDGRNAHLIVQDSHWWLNKICDRFELMEFQRQKNDAFMVLKSKEFHAETDTKIDDHEH